MRFRNEEKDGARIFGRGTTGTPGGLPGQFRVHARAHQLDHAPARRPPGLHRRKAPALRRLLRHDVQQPVQPAEYRGRRCRRWRRRPPRRLRRSRCRPTTAPTSSICPAATASRRPRAARSRWPTPTPSRTMRFRPAPPCRSRPASATTSQGKVDTTLAQAGIVSRPMPKLTLRADLRYEDRDDKTPVRAVLHRPPGHHHVRRARTSRARSARPRDWPKRATCCRTQFRLTGGVDVEEKKRNTSPVRIVSYRETTEEMSYRVELRRSMSETFTGAISYVYSDRDGSPFLTTTVINGAPGSNLIAPLHLADRERDKVRFSSNWTPIDPLTIQFFVDYADDRYSGRDGSGLGPRKGRGAQLFAGCGLHASRTSGRPTPGTTATRRAPSRSTCEGASSVGVCPADARQIPIYSAKLRNVSDSFGIGLRGKPNGRLEVGARPELLRSSRTATCSRRSRPPTSTVAGAAARNHDAPHPLQPLREVRAREEFRRAAGLHLRPLQHQRLDLDQLRVRRRHPVSQDPNQKVHFIGVSYYYRWQ